MKNITINNKSYDGVQSVQIPLSDGSGNANFIDTTGATATAGNIEKGYNAYVDGKLVVGTKENEISPVVKLGEYNVVMLTNDNSLEVSVVKGLLKDLPLEERIETGTTEQSNFVLLIQEQDKANTTDSQFYLGMVWVDWSTEGRLVRANFGWTTRLQYTASGVATKSTSKFMGVASFGESQGYVREEDLVVNQFDKFPSGKVTAYLVPSPF